MTDPRARLHQAFARLWFDRISVLGRERLPRQGPALYVGLHRNGAVDAFVHRCLVPRATFLVAARWRRGIFRALFDGIAVVRDKDAPREDAVRASNAAAIDASVEHLRRGGELDVFPEGTSTLGPRHQPFRTGAARMLERALRDGCSVAVVPIGLHYERAWAFRSRVDVVVGDRVDTELDPALDEEARARLLHARIVRALETVGVQFADEEEQRVAEALAYAATLGTSIPYARALNAFERGVPDDLRDAWRELERDPAARRAWLHQGVPLVPIGSVAPYALALLLLGPLVAAGAVVNLPPILLAAWAGKQLPDDRNVIALWRILVGFPAFLAWSVAVVAAASILRVPAAVLAWLALTAGAFFAWYRTKKLAVAVHNAIVCGALRGRLLDVHRRAVEHARR
jgi:1-acyl-sn-glycerol-3-phosphate acyltransferase